MKGAVRAFFAGDGEGGEEGGEEEDEFAGGEIHAGAGAVAVAEACVAAEVGVFG